MNKKIGVIGEALIDKYQNKKAIGGASFNVVCSLAAQGNDAYFLGSISTDEDGVAIENELKKYNVNSKFVERTNKPTTYSQVLLDEHNERTFTFVRSSDAEYEINDFALNDMKFNFVHFGSATGFLPGRLSSSYTELRDYCIEKGIKYSFDPNYREALWKDLDINKFIEEAKKFIASATVGKISDNELILLTGVEDLQNGLNKLRTMIKRDALICITRGSDDTIVLFNGGQWQVPVVKAEKVADTTGAGDAFASRLIHLYNQTEVFNHQTVDSIVKQANEYAKQAVEYVGALTYLNK